MALEKPDVVDAIGTDKVTGATVLTLMDAREWRSIDVNEHLDQLRLKLKNYVHFVESGQLARARPTSVGIALQIDIVFRCTPPEGVRSELESTAQEVERAHGIPVRYRTHRGGS